MGIILYKYWWNRSLDNKFMKTLLDGMSAWAAHVDFLNETILVQKVV